MQIFPHRHNCIFRMSTSKAFTLTLSASIFICTTSTGLMSFSDSETLYFQLLNPFQMPDYFQQYGYLCCYTFSTIISCYHSIVTLSHPKTYAVVSMDAIKCEAKIFVYAAAHRRYRQSRRLLTFVGRKWP